MLGCGCLFAMGAAFFPRLAVLFVWLFTPLVNRAFTTFIWPLLGIIFLPFTTLMWVIVAPTGNVYGADWIWLALAFVGDLATHAGGGYGNRNRVPGYGQY